MPFLTQLATILEAAGLKTARQPGWESFGYRGRSLVRVAGIMLHHTANGPTGNFPSLNVCRNGRPGIPGPLCQLGLGRDGTYYVIAAGLANHAGDGSFPGIPSGNSYTIGIEAENMGNGRDPWPDRQRESYVIGVAALCEFYGVPTERVVAHAEWATPRGRKIDPVFDATPGPQDYDEFRRAVDEARAGNLSPVIVPKESPTGRPTLRRGAKGELVALIQRAIGVKVDSSFGPKTEAALRIFQAAHDLVPDGVAGPATFAVIDRLAAG